MKKSKFSDFERYILLSGNSELNAGYESFLKFKEVLPFLNQIASTNGDTFLYNGTIYKKKITSGEARKLLDGFLRNRCYDIHQLRKAANQLTIRL
tara:strand:- start:163 stop:447 length:285 start_codon:yes stop_codon:yes gene_type:complete